MRSRYLVPPDPKSCSESFDCDSGVGLSTSITLLRRRCPQIHWPCPRLGAQLKTRPPLNAFLKGRRSAIAVEKSPWTREVACPLRNHPARRLQPSRHRGRDHDHPRALPATSSSSRLSCSAILKSARCSSPSSASSPPSLASSSIVHISSSAKKSFSIALTTPAKSVTRTPTSKTCRHLTHTQPRRRRRPRLDLRGVRAILSFRGKGPIISPVPAITLRKTERDEEQKPWSPTRRNDSRRRPRPRIANLAHGRKPGR